MLWIGSKLIGIKLKKQDPLDLKGTLYDVQQIRFTVPLKPYPPANPEYVQIINQDTPRTTSDSE